MSKAIIIAGLIGLFIGACTLQAAPVGPWRGCEPPVDWGTITINDGDISGVDNITATSGTVLEFTATTLNAPVNFSGQIESESTAATVGTVKYFFTIPDAMDGFVMADAGASVYTAGVTGALDVSFIKRTTAGAEATAYTASVTTGVVEASTGAGALADRTFATGDKLIIRVTAIHSGTASKGFGVRGQFTP